MKHGPFTDDGVTYCGWDGHEGCGETWPCATQQRDEALAEVERLNRAITRVLVLIAPETQMAQPLYGDRYFDEADIRNALKGPA